MSKPRLSLSKPHISMTHHWLRNIIQGEARGAQAAIPLPVLAERMSISTRKVQQLKADWLEHGVVICSSCGANNGLFWPTDAAEIEPYARNMEARRDAVSAALGIVYAKIEALRPVVKRTPPLRHYNKGAQVTAQMTMAEELSA